MLLSLSHFLRFINLVFSVVTEFENFDRVTNKKLYLCLLNHQRLSQNWDFVGLEEDAEDDEAELPDAKKESQCSRSGPSSSFFNREHICLEVDHTINPGLSVDRIIILQTSPGMEASRLGRTGSKDFKTIMSCNRCRPATISRENGKKKKKCKNIVIPIADSQSLFQTPLKN